MRLTNPLGPQNLYRIIKNQWKVARKKRIPKTPIEEELKKGNFEVIEANSFVEDQKPIFDFSSIVGLAPRDVLRDESHPMYKQQACHVYGDSSVLLEGLAQAMALTNTVQLVADQLPPQLDPATLTIKLPNQDELVKRCIRTSCLHDAEQKKLPIRKDPARPAWNFPRDYGITDKRKNLVMCSQLIQLCEMAAPGLSAGRSLLLDAPLRAALRYEQDTLLLQLRADMLLSTDKPLPALVTPSDADAVPLPPLLVSHPLISIEEENFYDLENIFSIKEGVKCKKVHTIVVHYNNSEVRNIHGSPVTLPQLLGRSLLKAYTAAVTQARHTHGAQVEELPEPVVVQCVQTDGRSFHFSVLQLNSASLQCSRRNVFWSLPPLDLYKHCEYVHGVPVLEDYNPLVFKHLLAFYLHGSSSQQMA